MSQEMSRLTHTAFHEVVVVGEKRFVSIAVCVESPKQGFGEEYVFRVVTDIQQDGWSLHWGFEWSEGCWDIPPLEIRPRGTVEDINAAVTPLTGGGGKKEVVIRLPYPVPLSICFVLRHPQHGFVKTASNENFRFPVRAALSNSQMEEMRNWVGRSLRPDISRIFDLPHHGCPVDVYMWRVSGRVDVLLVSPLQGRLKLHWGVCYGQCETWQKPDPRHYPPDTEDMPLSPRGGQSVETPFSQMKSFSGMSSDSSLIQSLKICFPADETCPTVLCFLLKHKNEWIKFRKGDFVVRLPAQEPDRTPFRARVESESVWDTITFQKWHVPEFGTVEAGMLEDQEGNAKIGIDISQTNCRNGIVHWGIGVSSTDHWLLPPKDIWPEGSVPSDGKSIDSPMKADGTRLYLDIVIHRRVRLSIAKIYFVLFDRETGKWFNTSDGSNFVLPTNWEQSLHPQSSEPIDQLLDDILTAERGGHVKLSTPSMISSADGWNQVRRLQLIQDIAQGNTNESIWTWVFVWMRFVRRGRFPWHRITPCRLYDITRQVEKASSALAHVWTTDPSTRNYVRAVHDQLVPNLFLKYIPHELQLLLDKWRLKGIPFYEEIVSSILQSSDPNDVHIAHALLAMVTESNVGAFEREIAHRKIDEKVPASVPRLSSVTLGEQPRQIRDVQGIVDLLEAAYGSPPNVEVVLGCHTSIPTETAEMAANLQHNTLCITDINSMVLHEVELGRVRQKILPLLLTTKDHQLCSDLLFFDNSLQYRYCRVLSMILDVVPQHMIYDPNHVICICYRLFSGLLTGFLLQNPTHEELKTLYHDWQTLAPPTTGEHPIPPEGLLLLKVQVGRLRRTILKIIEFFMKVFPSKLYQMALNSSVPQDKSTRASLGELMDPFPSLLSKACDVTEFAMVRCGIMPPWRTIHPFRGVVGCIHFLDEGTTPPARSIVFISSPSSISRIPSNWVGIVIAHDTSQEDLDPQVVVPLQGHRPLPSIVALDRDAYESFRCLHGAEVTVHTTAAGAAPTIVPCSAPRTLRDVRCLFPFPPLHTTLKRKPCGGGCDACWCIKCNKWIIRPRDFTLENTGVLPSGLARLQDGMDEVVPAAALPFNVLDMTLEKEENLRTAEALRAAIAGIDPVPFGTPESMMESEKRLKDIRGLIRQLHPPTELFEEVRRWEKPKCPDQTYSDNPEKLTCLRDVKNPKDARIASMLLASIGKSWSAITNAWCSQFTPTFALGCIRAKMDFSALRMAVFIHEAPVVDHTFRIGTINATTVVEVHPGIDVEPPEYVNGFHSGQGFVFTRSQNATKFKCLAYPSSNSCMTLAEPSLAFRPSPSVDGLDHLTPSPSLTVSFYEAPRQSRIELRKERLASEPPYRREVVEKLCALNYKNLSPGEALTGFMSQGVPYLLTIGTFRSAHEIVVE